MLQKFLRPRPLLIKMCAAQIRDCNAIGVSPMDIMIECVRSSVSKQAFTQSEQFLHGEPRNIQKHHQHLSSLRDQVDINGVESCNDRQLRLNRVLATLVLGLKHFGNILPVGSSIDSFDENGAIQAWVR